MADREYREALRQYHAGDVSLIDSLIVDNIRNGFGLLRMEQDGLPWSSVKKYLHFINRNILSPDEVELYKQMAIEEWGHPVDPNFVNRVEFFVPCSSQDTWAGNWPGNMVAMHIYFSRLDYPDTTGLSARKIKKRKLDVASLQWTRLSTEQWGTAVKITFWGTDDTGMEREMTTQYPFPHHATASRRGSISQPRLVDYPESIAILDDLIQRLPSPVTQRWLLDNGFDWI